MHTSTIAEWNRDDRRGEKICAARGHTLSPFGNEPFVFCSRCGVRICAKCRVNIGRSWQDAQEHRCEEGTP
jgi:hypothetical protein